MGYRAVTESGTVYEYGSRLKITSARTGITVFTPYVQVAVSREELEGIASWADFHARMRELEEVDLPVVGKSLYAEGRDEWRLSTPIVSVEETDD